MDSFDKQRLEVYHQKIFAGIELSEDQRVDLINLRKRKEDELTRQVLREEREELRRKTEEDRKRQRELFLQQRELLLLSRRIVPLRINTFQDNMEFPHVRKSLSSLNATSSSSSNGSVKLSPIQDDRHATVCQSPPFTNGFSVDKMYASPKKAPIAYDSECSLPLHNADAEESVYTRNVVTRQGTEHKTVTGVSSGNRKYGRNSDTMKFKRVRPPSPDSDSVVCKSSHDNDNLSEHSLGQCEDHVLAFDNQSQYSMDLSGLESKHHSESEIKENTYVETFEVFLSDIKGPLGKHSGGLRRYFKKLLENFVSTGCIYRTVSKIGICVHGSEKVLDIVEKILNHAMENPLSPSHRQTCDTLAESISWKYRSTGRTIRHGTWKKLFITKLCDNARCGKYSPRGFIGKKN